MAEADRPIAVPGWRRTGWAMPPRIAEQTPASPLYFVNWWVDAALVGGLSLLAWLAAGAIDFDLSGRPVLVLTLLFSLPHFSATAYRLYQSPRYTRQFPVTAWGLPFLLVGAVLAALWQPTIVAPCLLLLYFVWSPYHYSGQTIGLTMIYAKRSGFPIGRNQRLALTVFVLATFVASITAIETGGSTRVFDIAIPLPVFPAWLHPATQAAMAVAALVFAGYVVAWCREQKRLLPPIVLLPALTQFVWFVPGRTLATFFVLIPLFHALQYLMVACVVQLQRRLATPGAELSWKRAGSEAMRWWLRNIVGGVLLFYGIPILFAGSASHFLMAVGIVAAAVNIHHFFVDGVIWKLRDASNASALTMNVAELMRKPAPVPLPVVAAARSA